MRINEESAAVLREAGCDSAVFWTDSLPTNAQVTVRKMGFDDRVSLSLAEATESAQVVRSPRILARGYRRVTVMARYA